MCRLCQCLSFKWRRSPAAHKRRDRRRSLRLLSSPTSSSSRGNRETERNREERAARVRASKREKADLSKRYVSRALQWCPGRRGRVSASRGHDHHHRRRGGVISGATVCTRKGWRRSTATCRYCYYCLAHGNDDDAMSARALIIARCSRHCSRHVGLAAQAAHSETRTGHYRPLSRGGDRGGLPYGNHAGRYRALSVGRAR